MIDMVCEQNMVINLGFFLYLFHINVCHMDLVCYFATFCHSEVNFVPLSQLSFSSPTSFLFPFLQSSRRSFWVCRLPVSLLEHLPDDPLWFCVNLNGNGDREGFLLLLDFTCCPQPFSWDHISIDETSSSVNCGCSDTFLTILNCSRTYTSGN